MITLKTLPEASAQSIYDQVKAHLLSQNAKSIKDDKCVYRGPNGLKCAAGCLIADDEYKPKMDKCGSWYGLKSENLVPDEHWELILKLQEIHDWYDVEEWKQKLEELAVTYNLVP